MVVPPTMPLIPHGKAPMYNPDIFRCDDLIVIRRWIADNPFGILVTAADGDMVATHLPFGVADVDGQGNWKLVGHMAAANRQSRLLDGKTQAMVIFSGPHAYISPTLYGPSGLDTPTWHYNGTGAKDRHEEPALPTWNYVAVHAYGVPSVLASKREVLARQVETHEPSWRLDNLPHHFLEDKQSRIVAFEMPVDRVEGKAKLGQRQAPDERNRVADALSQSADSGVREVARMMKEVP